jgi:hypothetical protein
MILHLSWNEENVQGPWLAYLREINKTIYFQESFLANIRVCSFFEIKQFENVNIL